MMSPGARSAGVVVRLALVSSAPTPALRAARFPIDEDVDADGLRRAATAAAAAAGALPARARVLTDGSARARQTASALCLHGTGTSGTDCGTGTAADTHAHAYADADASRLGGGGAESGVEAALRDLDVGDWRGRGLDEIPLDELRRWHEDPAMAPPGGESRADLLNRIGGWLARVGGQPGGVIAVTHPAVVRAVLLLVLRCPPEVFWRIDVAPLTATLLH
ncbi:histidine phosphatase family protein, partial [Frankia tisae]|uniref:histidine phosphatase family protein n=1 Tax=Frankia tisae TaxID=2950104 RepID=UPI0021C238A4